MTKYSKISDGHEIRMDGGMKKWKPTTLRLRVSAVKKRFKPEN
jgi:hypothetical protein